jgi:hypothetical protein
MMTMTMNEPQTIKMGHGKMPAVVELAPSSPSPDLILLAISRK